MNDKVSFINQKSKAPSWEESVKLLGEIIGTQAQRIDFLLKKQSDLASAMQLIEMRQLALVDLLSKKSILTTEEVDSAEKALREDFQRNVEIQYDARKGLQNVERPCKVGDSIIIGFVGSVDGVELPILCSEKHFVASLGAGELVPGVEENIVGMSPNEQKEFEIDIPKIKGLPDNLMGKKANLKVTLHRVKEKIVTP